MTEHKSGFVSIIGSKMWEVNDFVNRVIGHKMSNHVPIKLKQLEIKNSRCNDKR